MEQQLGVVQSDHISSQEDQIMIKQTEQYHSGVIAEDMESNGHSPLTNMRNPLNQAYLDAQPADLRGQINMISGYHHDANSRQSQ